MARLPYLSPEDLPEADRDLLARPINLARALANNPDAWRHVSRLGQWIRHEGRLDPRLRELAILQVGYASSSEYEYSHHVEIGRNFGVTDDDLAALAVESSGGRSALGELDRAVLRAAREMTADLRIADETWRVLEGSLDAALLVELVVVVGFYNMVVRVLASVEVDVEPGYRAYLDRFPLPGRRDGEGLP